MKSCHIFGLTYGTKLLYACMHTGKTIEVDKCCLPVYTTNTEVNLYLIRTDLHTEYSFENQEVRAPTALEI